MKKFIVVLMACVLLISVFAVSVSAATPNQEVLDAITKVVKGTSAEQHLPVAKNLLSQITVTEEQAKAVIADIDGASKLVDKDSGKSLDDYPADVVNQIVAYLDSSCETLGIGYNLVPAEDADHPDDFVAVFYLKETGKKLIEFDGDVPVKKTNTDLSVTDYLLMTAAALLAVGSVAAVVVGKKVAAR